MLLTFGLVPRRTHLPAHVLPWERPGSQCAKRAILERAKTPDEARNRFAAGPAPRVRPSLGLRLCLPCRES